MLSAALSEELKNLCVENGFHRRRNAYFRVIGDGVFQVIKFEYEPRSFCPYHLQIGLFSMYGALMEQWFTPGGCIPRYSVVLLIGERNPCYMKNGNIAIISMEEQLQILKSKGFDFLNGITTQQQLADGICRLDTIRYEKILWNDPEKFEPFLCSGNLESAAKVIEAILRQHKLAVEANCACSFLFKDEKEKERYCAKIEEECVPFREKLDMVQRRDLSAIQAYLTENYARNSTYARFCMGKQDAGISCLKSSPNSEKPGRRLGGQK